MAGEISSTARAPRGRGPRAEARVRAIFRSLHDCMIRKGYVKTTLADIAEGAGMSASHLLYYFGGKDDILEQYFARVAVRFLRRLEEISQQAPRAQVDLLAEWWFGETSGSRDEIGFMLECFGTAVHDEVLRVTKADFDARCKAYLRALFERCERRDGAAAEDLAEIAYALMIGLRSAVYFDEDVPLERARELFRSTLRRLCGFTA